MKTFIIKTEIEQFQEQYPELYQQIFDLGYNSYKLQEKQYEDYYDPNEDWDQQYAIPADNSTRYSKYDTWDAIYKKAQDLEFEGYKAGNRDWPKFMLQYKDRKEMYIAWNSTHKQFAIESDSKTIDELYEHLTCATPEGYTPNNLVDDLPF